MNIESVLSAATGLIISGTYSILDLNTASVQVATAISDHSKYSEYLEATALDFSIMKGNYDSALTLLNNNFGSIDGSDVSIVHKWVPTSLYQQLQVVTEEVRLSLLNTSQLQSDITALNLRFERIINLFLSEIYSGTMSNQTPQPNVPVDGAPPALTPPTPPKPPGPITPPKPLTPPAPLKPLTPAPPLAPPSSASPASSFISFGEANTPIVAGRPVIAQITPEVPQVQLQIPYLRELVDSGNSFVIQGEGVSYEVPATVIGSFLREVNIEVKPTTVNFTKYETLVPPTSFIIRTDEEEELNNFNAMITRRFLLGNGEVDTNGMTGIVITGDHQFRTVPTRFEIVDGKTYAVINSMTNSVYTVVKTDVKVSSVSNRWSENVVNAMATRHIVDAATFSPTKELTRADFAVYVAKAFGIVPNGTPYFEDISNSDPAAGAIAVLQNFEIVSGYPDGTFRPTAKISREEMAVMIYRLNSIVDLHNKVSDFNVVHFKDQTNVATWAKESLNSLTQLGIYKGYTDGTLKPQTTITHEEAIQVIYNALISAELL